MDYCFPEPWTLLDSDRFQQIKKKTSKSLYWHHRAPEGKMTSEFSCVWCSVKRKTCPHCNSQPPSSFIPSASSNVWLLGSEHICTVHSTNVFSLVPLYIHMHNQKVVLQSGMCFLISQHILALTGYLVTIDTDIVMFTLCTIDQND